MHVSKRMFADFEAYWKRLQDDLRTRDPGALSIPTRKQFNPMSIPKLLPNLFVVERVSDEELIVRLTGTAIDEAMERSITGINMLDLYEGREREFVMSAHRAMANQPCGAVLRRFATLTNGKGYELVSKSLPLLNDAGQARYVVGMMGADIQHLSPLGEPAVVSKTTITDFFFVDLGYGIPPEKYEWVKSQQAS